VRGDQVRVLAGEPVSVALAGQGPEITGIPTLQAGERRPDGTLITASVPQPAVRR
jgi:alpha,alpha-trehalose phosphorylase